MRVDIEAAEAETRSAGACSVAGGACAITLRATVQVGAMVAIGVLDLRLGPGARWPRHTLGWTSGEVQIGSATE